MPLDVVPATVLALEWVACVLIVVYSEKIGISPMPTLGRQRAVMIGQLRNLSDGTIYELGGGWGTLAVTLARVHPDRRVVAYELSPVPWLFSVIRARLALARNLEIRRADFFEGRVDDAAAVVCYLFPRAMERLGPKLAAELPPDALVVSNTFALPGWTPERTFQIGGLWPAPVYLYRSAGLRQASGSISPVSRVVFGSTDRGDGSLTDRPPGPSEE